MYDKFKVELDIAAQIPNPIKGDDVTVCSNCESEQLATNRGCSNCDSHFIGPIGFPPFDEWRKLTPDQKSELVTKVCREQRNFGKVDLHAQINGILIRVSFH